MANAKAQTIIEGKVFVELTEGEARVLEAIVGYGPSEFVNWFYKNLGTHYLKPHEKHTVSLFETLREGLSRELHKLDNARSVLNGTHAAVKKITNPT
jgi:predicted RNA binding protein with dsRBD fold (UPF0201 family)